MWVATMHYHQIHHQCLFIVFLLAVATMTLASCTSSNSTPPYRDFTSELKCMNPYEATNYSYVTLWQRGVVVSQDDYENLYVIRSMRPSCTTFVLPHVDFQQYLLLGQAVRVTGCDVEATPHLQWDQSNQQLTFLVETSRGFCGPFSMKAEIIARVVWILIPKQALGANYSIQFGSPTPDR
ncbi:hypothetical protein HY488_02200 [Candidatus Woesearchaeota archaeon]|nr:hypothetical protein [Candidatus Woesearchaeota archaeon]